MTSHSKLRVPGRFGLTATVTLVVGLCAPAFGRFARPKDVPVDRLVKNVSAFIAEHPKDPMGHYTLGRVHYLAFHLKAESLRGTEAEGRLPTIGDMFNSEPANAKLAEKQLADHLVKSVESFNAAIGMDPNNGLFELGLASVLEAAAGPENSIELPRLPGFKESEPVKDWKDVYLREAVAHHAKAFTLAHEADLKVRNVPIRGLNDLVSYEAGTRYLKLTKQRGVRDDEKETAAKVEKGLAELEKKPRGPVTPIVFSFDPAAGRLGDLLAAGATADFDLDGTGRPQRYPWVKPTTGILVWDPRHAGKIESGKQLFGTATFHMFWRDGYAALDALDDDRDGVLSGPELAGLAVWRDLNGNGNSDAGEVMPIESVGVAGIAVRATGRDGASPCNRMGLRLRGGRTVPTWDWVAEAVPVGRE